MEKHARRKCGDTTSSTPSTRVSSSTHVLSSSSSVVLQNTQLCKEILSYLRAIRVATTYLGDGPRSLDNLIHRLEPDVEFGVCKLWDTILKARCTHHHHHDDKDRPSCGKCRQWTVCLGMNGSLLDICASLFLIQHPVIQITHLVLLRLSLDQPFTLIDDSKYDNEMIRDLNAFRYQRRQIRYLANLNKNTLKSVSHITVQSTDTAFLFYCMQYINSLFSWMELDDATLFEQLKWETRMNSTTQNKERHRDSLIVAKDGQIDLDDDASKVDDNNSCSFRQTSIYKDPPIRVRPGQPQPVYRGHYEEDSDSDDDFDDYELNCPSSWTLNGLKVSIRCCELKCRHTASIHVVCHAGAYCKFLPQSSTSSSLRVSSTSLSSSSMSLNHHKDTHEDDNEDGQRSSYTLPSDHHPSYNNNPGRWCEHHLKQRILICKKCQEFWSHPECLPGYDGHTNYMCHWCWKIAKKFNTLR